MPTDNFSCIDKSLLQDIQNSADLKSIADELAEVTLDTFLDDGLAKSIPVVSIFRSLQKASSSVSDYLLTKKIIEFLRGIEFVSLSQRKKQINKLTGNPEYRERVGENLMLLLERLDDMRKPQMVAKAWRAYLEERIDAATLFKLTRAIERFDVSLSQVLLDIYEKDRKPEILSHVENNWWTGGLIEPPGSTSNPRSDQDWDLIQQLVLSGLMMMKFGGGGGIGGWLGGLCVCKLGRVFVDVILMDREKIRPWP